MPDGSFRRIPEDPGIPTMILFGTLVEPKLRNHTPDMESLLDCSAEIICNVCGRSMATVERISGTEWAIIRAIARKEEKPQIPAVHRIIHTPWLRQRALAINAQIRADALKT
jgi:hypothetical protein